MANDTFFISWQLWQQMSFCLGGAIVIVFCAGLIKLAWITRYMKQQEKIETEKRSHIRELRKSGLEYRGNFDIPFGVRAIQSGIEVDGIWISRPNSPMPSPNPSPKLQGQSTSTLVELDAAKGKGKATDSSATSSPLSRPVDIQLIDIPPLSPRDGSHNIPTPTMSAREGPAPSSPRSITGPQAYQPRQAPHNRVNSQADALRQLEGRSTPQRPVVDTYVPTSSYGQAVSSDESGRFADRSSDSSSDYERPQHLHQQPPSARALTPTQQSYNASNSSLTAGNRRPAGPPRQGPPHHPGSPHGSPRGPPRQSPPRHGSPAQGPRNPFVTPGPNSNGAFSQHDQAHRMPSPTFAPGNVHVNGSTRQVNSNFEVHPAGSLGPTGGAYSGEDTDLESGERRPNKLQKAPPRPQR